MATFKQDKLRDFTVIRNAIFRDYTLSAKAKGVACQLLSLPPTWDYSVEGLTTLFDDGKASIRSALQELEEHGYLRREQVRADGKFGKSVYVISDLLPSEKPSAEKRTAENPSAGNPPQLNTKESNTDELNTYEYSLSNGDSRKSKFIPPTVGEVSAYINEKGYNVDAEQFVDFYESKGWMVGRNKMVSWQSAVRNWARRDKQNTKPQKSTNPFMDMLREGNY